MLKGDLDDDTLPVAKETLTFMAVALNEHWKMAVGCFLLDGLSAFERRDLTNQRLSKLHATGLEV